METRRSTGSLSSLTGSGTFTPPMSPRVESPRAAAAVGEKRQGSGKGIQMQIQQLASKNDYPMLLYIFMMLLYYIITTDLVTCNRVKRKIICFILRGR